jgi:CrcB protein
MSGFLVFLGGGFGALMRYALSSVIVSPWGTFGCNVIGSFLLAFFLHPDTGMSPQAKLLLGTGAMGGFTTYSTFNHEVLSMLRTGDHLQAATLGAVTMTVCLLAGAAGFTLAGFTMGKQA